MTKKASGICAAAIFVTESVARLCPIGTIGQSPTSSEDNCKPTMTPKEYVRFCSIDVTNMFV